MLLGFGIWVSLDRSDYSESGASGWASEMVGSSCRNIRSGSVSGTPISRELADSYRPRRTTKQLVSMWCNPCFFLVNPHKR